RPTPPASEGHPDPDTTNPRPGDLRPAPRNGRPSPAWAPPGLPPASQPSRVPAAQPRALPAVGHQRHPRTCRAWHGDPAQPADAARTRGRQYRGYGDAVARGERLRALPANETTAWQAGSLGQAGWTRYALGGKTSGSTFGRSKRYRERPPGP